MLMLMLVGVSVSASAQSQAANQKAVAALQGTWVLSTADGQSMMPGGELALVIKDNTYSQTANGEVNERGTFKVDATKKPMTLDLTITEGGDAGKIQLGLIDIKGDTMTGVLKFPGDTVRPTDMSAQPNAISFIGKKKAK
jgi:uncharacterized protein (TIGR03067 family)